MGKGEALRIIDYSIHFCQPSFHFKRRLLFSLLPGTRQFSYMMCITERMRTVIVGLVPITLKYATPGIIDIDVE